MNHLCPTRNFIIIFILLLCISVHCSYTDDKKAKSSITDVTSTRQLDNITTKAKDRLLILDFYEERCMSCYMLHLQLEKIAAELKEKATIYTINVSQNPELAKPFNIPGTPCVVYVKNQNVVHVIAGRQETDVYVQAIDRFAN